MQGKPNTIDEFLGTLDAEKREALERVRHYIRALLPAAEECMSYGVPGFRLEGRLVISFGAGARHCALYPGARPIELLASELKGFELAKGTIRFAPEKPLSEALVRRLVSIRIAERAASLDDRKLLAECDVETLIASGPGGQHRNKTESGVRLTHRPTGLAIKATERRSQYENRQVALERLREKLEAMLVVKRARKATAPSKAQRRHRVEAKRRQGDKKRARKELGD